MNRANKAIRQGLTAIRRSSIRHRSAARDRKHQKSSNDSSKSVGEVWCQILTFGPFPPELWLQILSELPFPQIFRLPKSLAIPVFLDKMNYGTGLLEADYLQLLNKRPEIISQLDYVRVNCNTKEHVIDLQACLRHCRKAKGFVLGSTDNMHLHLDEWETLSRDDVTFERVTDMYVHTY